MEIKERKRYSANIKKFIIDIMILLLLILTAEGVIYQFKSSVFEVSGRAELTLGLSERNGGIFLKYEDINALEANTGNGAVAYSGEISGAAGYEGKYERVCIMASNEYVFDYYPYKIIKGNFLTKLHCENGSRVAVISRILAERLFMSCDIIGYGIYIDGSLYRVAGVYDEIITPVTLFSLDDAERVFIPLVSYDKFAEIPISSIFIGGDGSGGDSGNGSGSGNGDGYDLGYFTGRMGEKYYTRLKAYDIKGYTRSPEFISQFVKVDFFAAGLFLIFLFLRRMISATGAFYFRLKGSIKDSYLTEALKKQKKSILLYIAEMAVIIAGVLIIYYIVHFTPFLPEEFIPEDNLFDAGFYFGRFVEYIRTENNVNFRGTIYNICFKTSLIYILFLSLFIFIYLIKTFSRILKLTANKTFQGVNPAGNDIYRKV
ncbi:MAG: ABC transporter permease [Clostridiaceae bacterium]